MKEFNRRDFLKIAGMGTASIIIAGCGGGGGGGGVAPAGAVGAETLNFTITDAVKEMVTHEPNNPGAGPAECYFWVFQENRFPADCPGPQVYTVTGDIITVNVTNTLDGPHAFSIPGMVDTGPIAPGQTVTVTFTAGAPGTYLYHDNLNSPVNRVMGLHGAFVVMPRQPVAGQRFTPYGNPTAAVQLLFNDFGSQPWWPGLSWEAGDEANGTPPFRQHVWLAHQASPVLFDEVGLFAQQNPGQDFPAAEFIDAFCNDPFINTSNDPRSGTSAQFPNRAQQVVTLPDGVTTMVAGIFNRKPHFFTINGQSGFFAHHNPAINPMYRVGEPCLVRMLNAGLWSHCWHLHSNHFFVTAIDNVPQEIALWIDVFNILPMRHVDYVIPFMRPVDVPNERGIGRADQGLPTLTGGRTWPPVEELARRHPNIGQVIVTNFAGTAQIDLEHQQSPLCYPMHDHSEPTQTAQGGNYNCGQIAGLYYLGDRNTPGAFNFPIEEHFQMMIDFGKHSGETGPPVGGWPPEDELG
jgi:FtsP/CotA-like multicopper oxidase with cupredoxin domain